MPKQSHEYNPEAQAKDLYKPEAQARKTPLAFPKKPSLARRACNVYGITILLVAVSLIFDSFFANLHAQQVPIQFEPKQLVVDANEGIDLADIDRDGKLDVVAGRFWYPGPDFRPRPLRNIDDWNGYVQSNGDFVYDVNQDGWPDVIAGSFLPTKVHWFQNPGREKLKHGQLWKQHLLFDTKQSQNEISFFRDLDGDQVPEWITNSWNGNLPVLVWTQSRKEQKLTWKRRLLGAEGQGHGMGFGDLNGDGNVDVLTATGWYEHPGTEPWAKPWKFHPDWSLGQASCPILVRDLDQDGWPDLIWGKGHDFGLYWWQGKGIGKDGKLLFESHLIDESFSQPHVLHMADLDGDGTEELITGKRVRAHNGGDPGGKEMACMYFYRWDKQAKKFSRSVIDEGHVGTGLQIRTGDLNGDGKTDIAVAGKDGTWILFNRSATQQNSSTKAPPSKKAPR